MPVHAAFSRHISDPRELAASSRRSSRSHAGTLHGPPCHPRLRTETLQNEAPEANFTDRTSSSVTTEAELNRVG